MKNFHTNLRFFCILFNCNTNFVCGQVFLFEKRIFLKAFKERFVLNRKILFSFKKRSRIISFYYFIYILGSLPVGDYNVPTLTTILFL